MQRSYFFLPVELSFGRKVFTRRMRDENQIFACPNTIRKVFWPASQEDWPASAPTKFSGRCGCLARLKIRYLMFYSLGTSPWSRLTGGKNSFKILLADISSANIYLWNQSSLSEAENLFPFLFKFHFTMKPNVFPLYRLDPIGPSVHEESLFERVISRRNILH